MAHRSRARYLSVCLQELTAPQDRFPARDIEKLSYQAIWQGQKAWNSKCRNGGLERVCLRRSHDI